jgi:hypothetical protein
MDSGTVARTGISIHQRRPVHLPGGNFMTTRVCLAFLLLIALSGLAAAAPGGAGPNPVAPAATALAAAPAVAAGCPAEGAELSLATASPAFMESLQISPARGEQLLLQRAPCTGCTGTRCTMLHSCVLNHCC